MNEVARLPSKDREILIVNTAAKKGVTEAVIEKDLWVSWILNYLFDISSLGKHLAFKGGTSLSKCYSLIQRFSEDIDIILDWQLLGYEKDEPWAERSRNKQDKFNKEANARTGRFIRDQVLPVLEEDFANLLDQGFSLFIDEGDPNTVCFAYPRTFSDISILPVVRIEIGALASWTEIEESSISPYAAQEYPLVFEKPSTRVLAVTPERTFWEKVTILHKESFRADGKIPARYSRHYYDVYCICMSPVGVSALAKLDLLKQVVSFKDRFYPSASAHYKLAKPGSVRLIPSTLGMATLRRDYEHMKNMLFGEYPSFELLMDRMKELEKEINAIGLL